MAIMFDYKQIPQSFLEKYFNESLSKTESSLFVKAFVLSQKQAKSKSYTSKTGVGHYLINNFINLAQGKIPLGRILVICDTVRNSATELKDSYLKENGNNFDLTRTKLFFGDTQIKKVETGKKVEAALGNYDPGTYLISFYQKNKRTDILESSLHNKRVINTSIIKDALFKLENKTSNLFKNRNTSDLNRVVITPLISIGSNIHLQALSKEAVYEQYSKIIEDYTAGLFKAINSIHSLNKKRNLNVKAFMAGLSVSQPELYKNLKIINNYFYDANWTKKYGGQLVKLQMTLSSQGYNLLILNKPDSFFENLYATRVEHGILNKKSNEVFHYGHEYKDVISILNQMQAGKGSIAKSSIDYKKLLDISDPITRIRMAVNQVSDRKLVNIPNIQKNSNGYQNKQPIEDDQNDIAVSR